MPVEDHAGGDADRGDGADRAMSGSVGATTPLAGIQAEHADTEPGEVAARRSWLVFLPLIAFVAIIVLLVARLLAGDASRLPSALLGKPVPQFALQPVTGLGKPGLTTADLRTGQPTILNVFASWCVPCREEAPTLDALAAQGHRLVGIAYKDSPEKIRGFLQEQGNPFSAVGVDASGRTGIDFGVYGVPETYVVKGDGTIIAKIVGPLTDDNIKTELMPALARAKG